jgi:hypothetical protein
MGELMSGLEVELGAAPVAAFLVPLDSIASAESDPVRYWAVLVELFRVLLLHRQRLETSHFLFGGSSNGK